MNIKYIISKLIKKIHISAIKDSKLDETAKVASGTHIINSKIGRFSYVGNFSTILNVEIGNFCSIADNCQIGSANHPINWVSTSPVFHQGNNILKKNFSAHEYNTSLKTVIGSDVWIGSNCLIKGGIKIGNGSIIGMGAVVTKNIGDFEIWAGNPAKLIRKRFEIETIESILESNWWNCSDSVIEEIAKDFNDIQNFIEKYKVGDN